MCNGIVVIERLWRGIIDYRGGKSHAGRDFVQLGRYWALSFGLGRLYVGYGDVYAYAHYECC